MPPLNFNNNWEQALRLEAAEGSALPRFLRIVEPVISAPLLLFHLNGRLLAASESASRDKKLAAKLNIQNGILSETALSRKYIDAEGRQQHDLKNYPLASHEESDPDTWAVSMYLTSEFQRLGFIMIFPSSSLEMDLALQLEAFLAPYFLKSFEFMEASAAIDSGASIVLDLLKGKEVGDYSLEQLGHHSALTPPWILLAVRNLTIQNHTHQVMLIREISVLQQPCISVEYENEVLILTDQKHQDSLVKAIFSSRLPGSSQIGISLPFFDLHELPMACRQILLVLNEDLQPGIHSCQDKALPHLLSTIAGDPLMVSWLHPSVAALRQYDLENQTDLLGTLDHYLQNNCNQVSTAKELFIHRNTLKYRLARIHDLTDIDLDSPDERLYLELSLKLAASANCP